MQQVNKELEEMAKAPIRARFPLAENVLTVDELIKFRNGVYAVLYWVYANEWSDKPTAILFPTAAAALEWYRENLQDRVKGEVERMGEEWGEPIDIEEWEMIALEGIEF